MTCSVQFWGTRGTVPVPGPSTLRYGGNTPCVEVEANGHRVILDAGTGLRLLGDAWGDRSGVDVPVTLLLSHTHWDHIHGLPFFGPLYQSGVDVRIRGHAPEGATLSSVLTHLMDPAVFPVPISELAAHLDIAVVGEEPFSVPGFSVQPFPLQHPGGSLGFAVRPEEPESATVIYVTDNELGDAEDCRLQAWRGRLVQFLRNADILIHDAMYDSATAARRIGWGHSSVDQAVDLALEAECPRLVLFHHAPSSHDTDIDRLLAEARERVVHAGGRLRIDAAREGETLTL